MSDLSNQKKFTIPLTNEELHHIDKQQKKNRERIKNSPYWWDQAQRRKYRKEDGDPDVNQLSPFDTLCQKVRALEKRIEVLESNEKKLKS